MRRALLAVIAAAACGDEVPVSADADSARLCVGVMPEVVKFSPAVATRTLSVGVRNCGSAPLVIASAKLSPLGEPFALRDTATFPLTLGPAETHEIPVFRTFADPQRETELLIATSAVLLVRVPIQSFDHLSPCPYPIITLRDGDTTAVHVGLALSARDSFSVRGTITSYSWSAARPSGVSRSPRFDPDPRDPNPTFIADVPGTYAISLQAVDTWGESGCPRVTTLVHVTP